MTSASRKFSLELMEEDAMPPEIDAAIKVLLCECFPPDVEMFSKCRHWHGTAPAYTLVYRDGIRVLGHVGVVLRRVRCGQADVEIAGIQSLAVAPSLRGSGLACALMEDAMSEAERRGIRFGLLFCVPKLERFYAPLGWVRTNVAATMMDESGNPAPVPAKNIGMYLELTDEPFPKGNIDLRGRDW